MAARRRAARRRRARAARARRGARALRARRARGRPRVHLRSAAAARRRAARRRASSAREVDLDDRRRVRAAGRAQRARGRRPPSAISTTSRASSSSPATSRPPPGFTRPAAVVDGASEVLAAAFGEPGRHARAAVGVAELPLGRARRGRARPRARRRVTPPVRGPSSAGRRTGAPRRTAASGIDRRGTLVLGARERLRKAGRYRKVDLAWRGGVHRLARARPSYRVSKERCVWRESP